MSEVLPPEWAIERAVKLLNSGRTDGEKSWVNSEVTDTATGVLQFASYIAEHEEAPVDPLLIEARAVCDAVDGGGYEDGTYDDGKLIAVALASLRRGIEIGEGQ